MKSLICLIFLIISFNQIITVRHHNTNEEYTKITKKILPDSELCNEQNCPSNRGTCSSENFCYCFDGYISTYETQIQCDYEQKDRVLYFLLEFILSFGIGHLYAGKYFYGIIKMICYGAIFGIYFFKFHTKKGIDAARIRFFLGFNYFMWQLIDGLCIFRGVYTDGNGKETGFKYF